MTDKKAIFAGSFDPFTLGHLDIVERSLAIFDYLYIVVATSPNKKPMYSDKQRCSFIKNAMTKKSKFEILTESGLIVELAKKLKVKYLVRSLRNGRDFDFEFQLHQVNSKLSNQIESIFIPAKPEYSFISSSYVREIIMHKGNLNGFVPEKIIKDLY